MYATEAEFKLRQDNFEKNRCETKRKNKREEKRRGRKKDRVKYTENGVFADWSEEEIQSLFGLRNATIPNHLRHLAGVDYIVNSEEHGR